MHKWLIVMMLVMAFGLTSMPAMTQTTEDATACSADEVRVNGECGTADIDSLIEGWNAIQPGGETSCAYGDPYTYWVHPGDSSHLLVFFQGGGGCWSAETCRDDGTAFNGFFDSRINASDDPRTRGGVLDLDNPDNPFSDYTVVYAPVCTGDVHWGDNVYDYGGGVVIHFKGFVNTSSALDWAYANVPEPDDVFLTGCSAGSPGSLMHAPYIIEQYPDARVTQVGDSLSLLFTEPVDLQSDWRAHDNFSPWIPALAEMQPQEWTMARHHIAVANHYPQHTFGQFNTVRDHVQIFYSFPEGEGDADDWTPLLASHIREIEAETDNYVSFTAGGEQHCITPGRLFYSYAANGVRFRDWVADLAAGRSVDSQFCDECDRPEILR